MQLQHCRRLVSLTDGLRFACESAPVGERADGLRGYDA